MEKKNFIGMIFLSALLSALLVSSFQLSVKTEVVPEEIPREQIIEVELAAEGPPTDFNPLLFATYYEGIKGMVYEQLAYRDMLSGRLKPWLAKDWLWVDNLTFEIKLRPEPYFRDGSPVTADDVVFTFETLAKPFVGELTTLVNTLVDRFDKVDDHTIRIHIKEDYPHNVQVLRFLEERIIPKAAWSKLLETYGDKITEYGNWEFEEIKGSGPYTPIYKSYDRIIMKRVDNYWGNKIGWYFLPRYYQVRYYGSNEVVTRVGLDGRQTDLAEFYGSPTWIKERKDFLITWKIDGTVAEMYGAYEAGGFPMVPNLNKPILRQTWLRQALAYAIDKKYALESAMGGAGIMESPTFLNPQLAGFKDLVNENVIRANYETERDDIGTLVIKYDPEKAVEILTQRCTGSVQEGWTYNGEKLGPWKIAVVQGWTDVMIEVDVIAKAWSDIGIPTEPAFLEYGTWASLWKSRDFDWIQGFPFESFGVLGPLEGLTTEFVEPIGGPWSGSKMGYQEFWSGTYPELNNTAGEVKQLITSLWSMDVGSDEYIKALKRVQEIIVPQIPMVPVYIKAKPKVQVTDRWVNWPTADDPLEYCFVGGGSASDLLFLKYVYPRSIETVDFSLSKAMIEAGETAAALVTLKNKANADLDYLVEITKGPAQPGLGAEVIASEVVTVPAGKTITASLDITLKEPGFYTLTVDNWRIGKYDPGEPIERTLVITKAISGEIASAVDAARSAETAAKAAQKAAEDALTALESVKTIATEAKEAAGTAAPMWMVWASSIVTIVVVLAGVYVITKSRK